MHVATHIHTYLMYVCSTVYRLASRLIIVVRSVLFADACLLSALCWNRTPLDNFYHDLCGACGKCYKTSRCDLMDSELFIQLCMLVQLLSHRGGTGCVTISTHSVREASAFRVLPSFYTSSSSDVLVGVL